MSNDYTVALLRRGNGMGMTTDPAIRWMSAKEVAERCGVSISIVYRRVREKSPDAPPHVWIMGSLRFPVNEFNQWLKEKMS